MTTPTDPIGVRALILSKGLRLSQFGGLMGSSKTSVNNWILRGLPGNRVFAACDVLGMSPEEIRPFTAEGSKPPPDVEAEINAFSRLFASLTPAQQHAALAQFSRHQKPLL